VREYYALGGAKSRRLEEMANQNPGSVEAIAAGCTCPVLDNNHGAGFPYGGKTSFWYNGVCPVHNHKEEDEDS
jgi:hypothetical protein